jgi:Ca-activated chloride channel family protein
MPTPLSSAAARVPAPIASPVSDHPYRGAEVVTPDGRSLPMVSARLRVEARGGIARLVLEQRFENSYAETLHVTYRMPLPADGAVSGYAFDFDGRTVHGRVERRADARAQFEQAIASGQTAALLEQERADIFTQSIGNLPARAGLTARITIDQRLTWLPEGEWELRFPTVIGPRYLGSTETAADAAATALVTSADGVATRIQLVVHIGDAIRKGHGASSPSHALRRAPDGALELRDLAGAALDRDIVVRWPVAGAEVGVSLAVARPSAPVSTHVGDLFGLVTIVPPARAARATPLARDMIILLDTSGSMAGGPLDKAKQVLGLVIESLGDADRLELIAFSSQPRHYKPAAVHATRAERAAAVAWLTGQKAGGGTEMESAVIEAMRALRPGSQRQVVLATDGYIGGEAQIVRRLLRDLPASCRLHFVGVGSAVNRTLSTAMARAGRGVEVLCGLDEDAERSTARLIAATRMPVLTDLVLSGSALIAHAPARLPDVFEGAPFVAAVQVQPGELIVRGDTATGGWEQRVTVPACRAGEGAQAIVQVYGRERVADLEARTFGGDEVDAEIEAIGIAFQIATRLTSWIAIDPERREVGAERYEDMPQVLPYGTTAAAFGLRQGMGPAMQANFTLGGPPGMLKMRPALRSVAHHAARSVARPDESSVARAAAPRAAAPSHWWVNALILLIALLIPLAIWWLVS